MPASCWARLASRNAAGEREPPLSNATQQVGEIWVCRSEKGLRITLCILESWSPASAHASSKEGTPRHGPTAGQAAGGSVPTLNFSLPLPHKRCKICVKKSACFREHRLGWSIPRLRSYPESPEPSRRYKESCKCLCAQCLWAQLLFREEPDTVSHLHLRHAGCHTGGPFSSSGLL